MMTVFGTIALDTTRTPFKTKRMIMGGAATYASLSSSIFTATSIVGVIGSDFPSKYKNILENRVNTKGIITVQDAKTFHYDSSFGYDLSHRISNKIELNVIANFEPVIADEYVDSEYVYLANSDPVQNIKILEQFSNPKLIVFDTMQHWISSKLDDIKKLMSKVDGVVINDEESRLLCQTTNLIKCAKQIVSFGPDFVIIKKGGNGALFLNRDDVIISSPAYPIEDIVDPTGAGDSFAGGFIGYIAERNNTSISTMKEAIVYGIVMGGFTVEGFGVQKLLNIKKEDVQRRYELYRNMINF